MRKISQWLGGRSGAILGALVVTASVTTVASAHSGSVTAQVIHSCVNSNSGVIKIIASTGVCGAGETATDWNAVGPKGEKGDQGIQGLAGAKGEKGDQGLPGTTGATGPAGPAGVAGIQGEPGLPGAKGEPGDQGPPGATGATGPAGPAGVAGPAGPVGATGPAGGASSYAIQTASSPQMFSGNVAEVTATCPAATPKVVSGGHTLNKNNGQTAINPQVYRSYPSSSSSWSVTGVAVVANSGETYVLTVYAMCAA